MNRTQGWHVILFALMIFTITFVVLSWQGVYEICKESDYYSMKRASEHFKKIFKKKQGWRQNSYLYISIDGGKQWFSAKQTENGYEQLKSVTEQSDSTFRRVISTGRLMDYIAKHGPIDPMDPKEVKLLEGTGISVRTK